MSKSPTILSKGAIAVLRQLFLKGPTWDGDIISKNHRRELIQAGLAFRVAGYASLTLAGVELAATSEFEREKQRS